MPESNSQQQWLDRIQWITVNYPIKIMPESNSQQQQSNIDGTLYCELSYKDNAWKQFTTVEWQAQEAN